MISADNRQDYELIVRVWFKIERLCNVAIYTDQPFGRLVVAVITAVRERFALHEQLRFFALFLPCFASLPLLPFGWCGCNEMPLRQLNASPGTNFICRAESEGIAARCIYPTS